MLTVWIPKIIQRGNRHRRHSQTQITRDMHGRKTANENRSIYPTHYISIHISSHPPSVKPLALFAGRLSIHLLGHIRRYTQANNTSQHGTLNPTQNTLDPPKSNVPFPYFTRMSLNKLAKDSDAQSNGGEVNDPMIVMPFYVYDLIKKTVLTSD